MLPRPAGHPTGAAEASRGPRPYPEAAVILLRSAAIPLSAILELWLPFCPFGTGLCQPQLQDRGKRGSGCERRVSALPERLSLAGRCRGRRRRRAAERGQHGDRLAPAGIQLAVAVLLQRGDQVTQRGV